MITRIRWSKSEKEAVAEELARLIRSGYCTHTEWDFMLASAQEVLPCDRHRNEEYFNMDEPWTPKMVVLMALKKLNVDIGLSDEELNEVENRARVVIPKRWAVHAQLGQPIDLKAKVPVDVSRPAMGVSLIDGDGNGITAINGLLNEFGIHPSWESYDPVSANCRPEHGGPRVRLRSKLRTELDPSHPFIRHWFDSENRLVWLSSGFTLWRKDSSHSWTLAHWREMTHLEESFICFERLCYSAVFHRKQEEFRRLNPNWPYYDNWPGTRWVE